jgi:DNA-binding MarR family transcriptional regulator
MAYARELAQRQTTRGTPLPRSQKSLLVHLEMKGNRVSVLAERMGISKQATSKIIAELEAKGFVKRDIDKHDARALRVRFTAKGRNIVEQTVTVFESIDEEMNCVLGEKDCATLRKLLEKWAAHLDDKAF